MTASGKSFERILGPDGVPLDDDDIFELGGLGVPPDTETVDPPQVNEDILGRMRHAVSAVRVVRRDDRDLRIKTNKGRQRLSFSWFELKVEGAPGARVLDVERFLHNHLLAFKLIDSAADTDSNGLVSEPVERLGLVWEHLRSQYASIRHCIAPWGARVLPYVASCFSERTLLNLEVMLNVRRWERLKEYTAFGTAFGTQVEGPFEKFMSIADNRFRHHASVLGALHLGLQQ